MDDWRVVLLSDDVGALQIWAQGLAQRGVGAVVADFTRNRPEQYLQEPPHLIIIDVYTAMGDALNVCRELRTQLVNPILMLAYIATEPQMVEAYEAGADECIAKPIGVQLLMAKVEAWLRRAWTIPTGALTGLEIGGLRLDPESRRLQLSDGGEIALTNLELRLVHLLMSHAGQVLESSLIIDRVWGYEGADYDALKNVVYRLRRKVETQSDKHQVIRTAPGGYLFAKT